MDLEQIVEKVDAGRKVNAPVGTEFLLSPEGMNSRFKSILVGIGFDSYLIVTTPQMTGSANKLSIGAKTLVRYMAEGSVHGFEATILGNVVRPVRLTFLSYPKFVQSHNLRRYPRAACHIPAVALAGDREYLGLIVDLSRSGCRFSFRVSGDSGSLLASDQGVELRFQLPGLKDNYGIRGTVRNLSRDDSQAALGVEFHENDEEILLQVNRFVERILSVKA